jgi:cytosine/adenosine deaminase-related metal-dependent hydrolase
VGIMDGKIAAIAPWATARAEWSASQSIDLEGQALMPGLVNAHTHTPMVYLRGFGDDLPLTTWLTERIWPAEGKCIGADFVRDGSELAVAEMLKSGTTCFNGMCIRQAGKRIMYRFAEQWMDVLCRGCGCGCSDARRWCWCVKNLRSCSD